MSNKRNKKIMVAAQRLAKQYGFSSLAWVEKDNYPAMQCDGVIVYRIPRSSALDEGKVAQNTLKRAREARKLGNNSCAYGGGK